jgi:hypothetical protein
MKLCTVFSERRRSIQGGRVANDDGEAGMAALWRLRATGIVLNIFAQELMIDFEVVDVGAI